MSMSEFERQKKDASDDSFGLSMPDGDFPDDFSKEDAEFARELDELFSLGQEEMPPLFVQTLLASNDPRFQSVERGFEFKTRAHVFRRLKLKRRLFRSLCPNLPSVFRWPLLVSRPVMTLVTTCCLFIVLTMVITAPSFASGVRYLWAGAHGGVIQVDTYPSVASPLAPNDASQRAIPKQTELTQLSLAQAQKRLHFPLYWPEQIPSRYILSDIYMYDGKKDWADGPIAVLDYLYTMPGVAARQITICEFKPRAHVFQVVKDGAAQKVKIGPNGSDSAIYVDGHWSQVDGSAPSWVYNDRSEYIRELNGVVFWIVGDNRDGIDQSALISITQSLKTYDDLGYVARRIDRVFQSDDDTPSIFANDVIYLNNPDSPDGPSFRLIGHSTSSVPHRTHLFRSDSVTP